MKNVKKRKNVTKIKKTQKNVFLQLCLKQTVNTHCASVHQAAKLLVALLRVAEVTAGLAESNGSLPLGL